MNYKLKVDYSTADKEKRLAPKAFIEGITMTSKDYEELIALLRESLYKVDDAYNKLADLPEKEAEADSIYNVKESLIDEIKKQEANYREAIRTEDFNGQFRKE